MGVLRSLATKCEEGFRASDPYLSQPAFGSRFNIATIKRDSIINGRACQNRSIALLQYATDNAPSLMIRCTTSAFRLLWEKSCVACCKTPPKLSLAPIYTIPSSALGGSRRTDALGIRQNVGDIQCAPKALVRAYAALLDWDNS